MTYRIALTSLIAVSGLFGALPAAAQSLDCSQFGVVASHAPGAGHTLNFTNSSDSRRTIMWLNESGSPTYMTDLTVGQSASYAVAPGDIFAMVDGPGNCVEMFRVTTGQTQFTMTAIATGEGGD